MPYIQIKTNIDISNEKKSLIKKQLGKSIELIVGKSEEWLMIDLSSNETMWFQGSSDPCIYLQLNVYGESSKNCYENFTNSVSSFINKELSIELNRIYISYFETNHWGWNGKNF